MLTIDGRLLSYKTRQKIRALANAKGTTCPIVIFNKPIDEELAPRVEGDRCMTSSSRWRQYRRFTYKPSTRRIEVGALWLEQHGIHALAELALEAMKG